MKTTPKIILLFFFFTSIYVGAQVLYDDRPRQLEELLNELKSRYDKVVSKDWLRDNLNNTIFLVSKKDKWGACVGNIEIIPLQYDELILLPDPKPNMDGNFRFVLKAKDKWGLGYIQHSKNGYNYKEILPLIYDEINPDCNHAAYFDTREITNIISVKQNNKWGVVGLYYYKGEQLENLKSIEIVPLKYDVLKNNFYHNYALVKTQNKWGILAATGKEKLAPLYDSIVETNSFCLNALPVQLNKAWGIYDLASHTLISEIKYDRIECEGANVNSKANFIIVWKNGKKGVVNRLTKKEVVPPEFTNININSNVITVQKDSKSFLYNENGTRINSTGYDKITDFGSLYSKIFVGEKVGFLDIKNGKEIIPPKYEQVEHYYTTSSNFFGVKEKKVWGFINDSGKVVVSPKYEAFIWGCLIYEEARDNIIVKQNKKWGIIHSTGDQLTPCKYDSIYKGMHYKPEATIKLNNKYGKLNLVTGKEIIPPVYDEITPYYNPNNSPEFEYKINHFFIVRLKNKTLYLDNNGKEIPNPHK